MIILWSASFMPSALECKASSIVIWDTFAARHSSTVARSKSMGHSWRNQAASNGHVLQSEFHFVILLSPLWSGNDAVIFVFSLHHAHYIHLSTITEKMCTKCTYLWLYDASVAITVSVSNFPTSCLRSLSERVEEGQRGTLRTPPMQTRHTWHTWHTWHRCRRKESR